MGGGTHGGHTGEVLKLALDFPENLGPREAGRIVYSFQMKRRWKAACRLYLNRSSVPSSRSV